MKSNLELAVYRWAILLIAIISIISLITVNFLCALLGSTIREYEEIHVESIEVNETYLKLLNYLHEHPKVRLMLLVKCWPNLTTTKLVGERYAQLRKLNCRFGLHVHIAVKSEINNVPYEDQLKVIRFGHDFLAGLNITTTHFAPGWWSYNRDTMKACQELGLTYFHITYFDYVSTLTYFHLRQGLTSNINIEDWEYWGVKVVPVKEYVHDWEL